MPAYKVKEKGFYEGRLYDPNGKRPVLTRDKAFNKCPAWLEPIKGESASEAKARQAKQAEASKTEKAKAEADKKAVDQVTFATKTL